MKNIIFIAWQDVRNQMRQGSTLLWLFLMPPIFFYFIGTVTGGFSSVLSGGQATPITVIAESPGFLREQIDLRLIDNDFAPEWVESLDELDADADAAPVRTLTFDPRRPLPHLIADVLPSDEDDILHFLAKPLRNRHVLITSPLRVMTSRMSQLSASIDQALAAVNSPDKRSTMKPFGDRRPMPAIQSGRAASGKKLPPAIISGNRRIVVTRFAALLFANNICNAANQANSPTILLFPR